MAACVLVLGTLAGCARSPHALCPAAEAPPPAVSAVSAEADEVPDYDPWEPFNERVFAFNHGVLDRYLVKPVATGWSFAMPKVARRGLSRMLVNLEMPRRLVNNVLQARPLGAGRELARFLVNTTVGVAGMFDVATRLHIEPSPADTGMTLALYGIGPGPYLVLPTLPPLTVRDAIGRGVDGALDPISYVLPFIANRAKAVVTAVNERSLNLEFFAGIEDSVLDLYAAARNGYLQRRRAVVRLATADRTAEWRWACVPAEPNRPMVASLPREVEE